MTDIHEGLVDSRSNTLDKTIIFSLGHRCTSSSLIKEMKQKFETYPFDWVVSKLDVIAHCIETEFSEFLKVENYDVVNSETFNLCDGEKTHIMHETVVYNKYYEAQSTEVNDIGTFGLKLGMTHHDIRVEKDFQYFQRSVERFKNILALDNKKYYLYLHPIMGFKDYAAMIQGLEVYFTSFSEYFKSKTRNSFGIFFVVVKCEERKCNVELLTQTDNCAIYVVYTNNKLVDGGGVFCGEDWYTEQYKILTTIEAIIQK